MTAGRPPGPGWLPGSARPQRPSPPPRGQCPAQGTAAPRGTAPSSRHGTVPRRDSGPHPKGKHSARGTAPPPRGDSTRAGPRDPRVRAEHPARRGLRSPGLPLRAGREPECARPTPTTRWAPTHRLAGPQAAQSPRGGQLGAPRRRRRDSRRARRAGPVYTRDRRRPRPRPAPPAQQQPLPAPPLGMAPPPGRPAPGAQAGGVLARVAGDLWPGVSRVQDESPRGSLLVPSWAPFKALVLFVLSQSAL